VVASVTPPALYNRLLDRDAEPDRVRRDAARYRFGAGTMMIHLALSEPPAWTAGGDLGEFAYVHIAPYVTDLADTYTSANNGRLPRSPLLIVGQSSAVDRSRAPAGQAVLWVQGRAQPSQIRGDAAGEIDAREWADLPPSDREALRVRPRHRAAGAEAR
jgi:phytoene dehydrogenase-like protein